MNNYNTTTAYDFVLHVRFEKRCQVGIGGFWCQRGRHASVVVSYDIERVLSSVTPCIVGQKQQVHEIYAP